MAANPEPMFSKGITITKGKLNPELTEILNHEAIEFHVNGFDNNKKYCNLLIYAVTYTNNGAVEAKTAQTTMDPTPVLLGTIKIGS